MTEGATVVLVFVLPAVGMGIMAIEIVSFAHCFLGSRLSGQLGCAFVFIFDVIAHFCPSLVRSRGDFYRPFSKHDNDRLLCLYYTTTIHQF
jgi:hypothetical protein